MIGHVMKAIMDIFDWVISKGKSKELLENDHIKKAYLGL